MNLFHKCIAFLLTILLFQLAVVVGLGLALGRAEENADRAAYSGRAIASCQHLTQNFFVASHCLLMLVATNTPATAQRFDDLCNSLEEEVADLQKEKHASPLDKQELEHIGEIVTYLVDEMKHVRNSYQSKKSPADVFQTLKFIRFEVNPHLHDLHELMDRFAERHKSLQKSLAGERQLRSLLRTSVLSAFFLNVLTTAAIVIGFSKGINARIGLIAENFSRYASKVPLHPVQGGHDEISLLDEKFHTLSLALDEVTAKDKAVFNNLPVALITCDQSNQIENLNPCAMSLFGLQTPGQNAIALSYIFSTEKELEQVTETAEGKRPGPLRVRCTRSDGTTFPAELSCSRFQHDGKTRTLLALVDVSDREKVDNLRQEFVSIVSHDIRTPLTSLRIFLSLLDDGLLGELSERGRKQLVVAQNESSRLIRLTADLLDISRLESGNVKLQQAPCQVDLLMVHSLDSVQQAAEKAGITLLCEPSNLMLVADGDRVVQILVNFLSNAIKYSPTGKEVTIAAIQEDDHVKITVTDQGRGIPSAELPLVFDRFRQVRDEDSRSGAGLGLAICRLLAEAHKGTTGASSVEGEGSVFWVRLPTTTVTMERSSAVMALQESAASTMSTEAAASHNAPATSDEAAAPHDAAATPHDAFATPHDASATPHDASAAPPDASATPHDASAAPPDASATPHDAFATPHDAAATPHDASAAPPDASATPHDASTELT